ncbi:MAG: transporter [Hydrocarboniphaga sp.]|uniref:MFS transporter n=1 Tax=Hydrocarboniphaga sp. TaxID=2033016 RepID=UPI00260BF304|nr:MFS transporter [Hydrocarboniphaga sp.]MDB5968712.1 transporter [Hydrocarboniphaga sp.]
MTTYLGELRSNWRALLAVSIGLGSGLSIFGYSAAVFAPHLLQTFGWSKSQFALIGITPVMLMFCLPLVGRLTDLFGARRVAMIGVVSLPLSFLALSAMTGDIRVFLAIAIAQVLLGASTTAAVYSRVVAEAFERTRGLALAIVTCGPPLVGGIGVPLLTAFIDAHGWKAGYQAMAVFSAVFGALALILIPRRKTPDARAVRARRPASQDYVLIAKSPAFWVIMLGFLLCNFSHPLTGVQLKLVLLDNGASSATASLLISMFAAGVIVGRFACGLALDRMPAHIVATVSMGLPGLGLLLLASSIDTTPALAVSTLLMGLSLGAEGDLAGFLVVRFFGLRIYSSVLGLVFTSLGIASALGSVLLSYTLKLADNYTLYVFMTAIAVLVGGAMFMLLGIPSIVGTALGEPGPDESAASNKAATLREPAG